MSFVHNLVLTCAALAAGPAFADNGVPKVAVVVGLTPGAVNVATVDLYREVVAKLGARGDWMLAPDADVRGSLPTDARLAALGSIAAINRGDLARAVQIKGKGRRSSKLIKPVQVMVDTLALDGAVLVDCRDADGGKLGRCAVLFYDRAAARVVAVSAKTFPVPIADATRWAPVLVDQLVVGLQSHRTAKAHAAMEAMVRESEDDTQSRWLLAATATGLTLHGAAAATTMPEGAVAFGTQGETFAATLFGAVGEARGTRGGTEEVVAERTLGLGVSARSRALETIYWDLGLSLGVMQRDAHRSEAGADVGKQTERALRLRLAPGLLWQVGPKAEVGPQVSWTKDLTLNVATAGAYEAEAVRTQPWGFGLRVQVSM